jgi:hypothetical protein
VSRNFTEILHQRFAPNEGWASTMNDSSLTTLITSCLLFSNIVSPSLSFGVVSPSCFYNAFVAAKTFTSSYTVRGVYFKLGRKLSFCLGQEFDTTTFSPPFIYSYNCASLLPVLNYFAVYMYMALVGGFIMPAAKVLLKLLHDHCQNMQSVSRWHAIVLFVTPQYSRSLYPHPYAVC